MGQSQSRSLINNTEERLERIAENPATAALTQPIDQPQLTKDAVEEIVRLALDERLSEADLFKIQMTLTNRLHSELVEKRGNPGYDLAARLVSRSKDNIEDALHSLKEVAQKIDVAKPAIRDAHPDNESSMRKLARKTNSMLSSMVQAAYSQITFSRFVQAYTVTRFGFSPLLIQQSYAYSGLGILGIASGVTCIGLSGRFLYIHPEILSFLKNFSNYNDFSVDNIDLYVLYCALYKALMEEISNLLKQGLLGPLKRDYQIFSPLLGKAFGWIGWASYLLEYIIQSENYLDIFNGFLKYLEEKTYLFTIINRITSAYTYVKDTTEKAAEKVKKTFSKGMGKAYKFIANEEYRHSTLKEAYHATKNLSVESVTQSIQSLGSSVLSYFTSTRDAAIIEMDNVVHEQLDIPQTLLEREYINEPGSTDSNMLPTQPQISGMPQKLQLSI